MKQKNSNNRTRTAQSHRTVTGRLLLVTMLLFTFVWGAKAQALFSEDFEGGSMPTGWTTDGSGTWSVGTGDYNASTGAGQGTYNALIKHGTTGNATKLITPEIDLSTVTSAELSFMHIQRSWAGDYDQLKVYYRTSSAGEWTQLVEYTSAVATWTTEEGIDLPNLSSTYQIAFEMTDGYGYGVGVDDVKIAQGSSCAKPTLLQCTSSTTSTATLSWTNGAEGQDTWQICLDGDEDNPITANSNPFTITGLDAGTAYTAKVRAYCSASEQSGWSNKISFATACEAITTFPWSEAFESYSAGDFTAPCWVNEHISGSGNKVFAIYTSTISGNATHQLQLPDQSDGTLTMLKLPLMTLPADNYSFVLDVYRSNSTYNNTYAQEGIRVFVSTNGDIEGATELAFIPRQYNVSSEAIPAEATVGWYTYELPIEISGDCYIILRGESHYCTSTYMDNFLVREASTCAKPTGVTASNVTAHEVTISWTSDADAWQIQVGEEEPIDVTTNPYTLTDLTPETAYSVKVRTDCGNDGYSDWTNPISFTTGIACTTPTNVTVSDRAGHSATITWTAVEGAMFQCALVKTAEYDVNNINWSESFDANTQSWNNLDPETGYTFALRKDCSESEDGYSQIVTKTFTTTVACPAPTVIVSNITTTTAEVSCTNTEADIFNVMLDDEVVAQNVAMPYTLTGLTMDKSYTVKVQAICGGEDGESEWSSGTTFMTAEECPEGMTCIGTGKKTSGYFPTYTFYNYSLTQQIYTADEIGGSGAIMSIDFYSTAAERTRNLDIYMVMTDKASFASNTDYISVTASDLVYSGSVTFAQNEWTTIQLNAPFAYADDTKNVALIVVDKTGGYVNSPAFLVFDATDMALYAYNDNYEYDPTNPGTYTNGSTYTFYKASVKNRVRLVMGEIVDCDMPTNLAVSDITMESANLTWTAGGSETAWQVCINGDEDNLIDVTDNAYQMTNLTAATTYTVKVRANCGNGQSYWTPEISFNTAICDAAEQCEINYEFSVPNTTYTTWHSATIDVVDVETNIVLATLTYDAAAPTGTVAVCDGREIKFVYNPASPSFYNGYNAFTFTDVNGEEIFSGTGNGNSTEVTVLYTHTVDCTVTSCKRPTDLAVTEIGGHSAVLSWTENGEATAWVVAYSTDGTSFNDVDALTNPFTLTGLDPETEYSVKVRPVCDDANDKWSDEITFTTTIACPAPTNLAIEPTPNSATVTWTSANDDFDVWYRELTNPNNDFDISSLKNWTTIDADGDGYTWVLGSQCGGVYLVEGGSLAGNGHNSSADMVTSGSYSNMSGVGALTPDNYLVSPRINLGGSITFWAQGQDAGYAAEHFGVAISTTGNTNADDFTTIQEWTMTAKGTGAKGNPGTTRSGNRAQGTWYEYTVDLSGYSGQGYVAIRHFNCTDQFMLNVDDIVIEQPNYVEPEWIEGTTDENTFDITNLSSETTYEVQVRSNCGDEDGNSSWAYGIFTTPSTNVAPYDLVATNVEATSATLNWTAFLDNYNVRYRTAQTSYFTDGFDDEDASDWTEAPASLYYWSGTSDYFPLLGYEGSGEVVNLISPELSGEYKEGSFLYFAYRVVRPNESESAMVFKVGYSTTTADLDAFTWGDEITSVPTWAEFEEVIPAGTKYFAIQTTDETANVGLVVDYFGVYAPAGEWVECNNVTSPLGITGLTPETEYEWQVQGIYEGGTTEWVSTSFTTEPIVEIELANDADDDTNTVLIDNNVGSFANVTLAGRKLWTDGYWNTLCLPFSLSAEQLAESPLNGYKDLRALTTATYVNKTLTLTFTEENEVDEIVAGTPYIIKWANNGSYIENPVFSNVKIDNTENNVTVDLDGTRTLTFKGTYVKQIFHEVDKSILFLGEADQLYWPEPEETSDGPIYPSVGACRAYFELGGFTMGETEGMRFALKFGQNGGEATGIISAKVSGDARDSWYTVDGVKLNGAPKRKGLYIHNGTKVVIK